VAECAGGIRHSILDMAPLELDCMNALWPLGEATVRDVHLALAGSRPRAYTTIMTILDRLAQKGVVARRKVGRAWVYRPKISI
jgi:BlaI family transcriptional regulator, penicillinase repressor